MNRKRNSYLFTGALICCLVQTPAFAAGDCEFSIKLVEAQYYYLADFYIAITNKTDKDILMKHFDGPPFEFVYRQGGKRYTLTHKADRYASDIGGSRAPQIQTLEAHTAARFIVDLKADYMVIGRGLAIPFRDFARDKPGVVEVHSKTGSGLCDEQKLISIEFNGLLPVHDKHR